MPPKSLSTMVPEGGGGGGGNELTPPTSTEPVEETGSGGLEAVDAGGGGAPNCTSEDPDKGGSCGDSGESDSCGPGTSSGG